MGILAPISVIDSANINKLGPLLATEWIATSKAASRQGRVTIPKGAGRLNRRRNSGQPLYCYID
jgi:hypothetical protein